MTDLIDPDGGDPDNAACFRAAIDVLAGAGADIVEVALPYRAQVHTAVMSGLTAEAFAYHRNDMTTRWTDYGGPTRTAIALAAFTGSADYVQAQRVRRVAVGAVAELFATVDIVAHPSCAVPAPTLADLTFGELIDSIHTQYWNGVGNPAISDPDGADRPPGCRSGCTWPAGRSRSAPCFGPPTRTSG